jgi:hypothetical protein
VERTFKLNAREGGVAKENLTIVVEGAAISAAQGYNVSAISVGHSVVLFGLDLSEEL